MEREGEEKGSHYAVKTYPARSPYFVDSPFPSRACYVRHGWNGVRAPSLALPSRLDLACLTSFLGLLGYVPEPTADDYYVKLIRRRYGG